MPSWHRWARVIGVTAIALGVAGMLFAFPFIYGEPGSVAESEEPNPAWFPVLASICNGLLVLGVLMLLAPIAHRILRRRKARR